MVDTHKIASVAKDVLLAPVYFHQGRRIKRNTVRLPEPDGERCGFVSLHPATDGPASDKSTLKLMIVGDSAAAGVGSQTQQEALVGKLIPILTQQLSAYSSFNMLDWSLQATTGHTSFDIYADFMFYQRPIGPLMSCCSAWVSMIRLPMSQ